MLPYVLRRLVQTLPTLLGVVVATFGILECIPGDPARAILGERATAAAVAQLRDDLGLDDPIYQRLGRYLGTLARGDLGRSLISHRPIGEELRAYFPATLELALFAMLFAVGVGVAVGIAAALRPGSWWDLAGMGGALVGLSMPIFWLGLVLLMLFVHWFPGWPTYGRLSDLVWLEPRTGLMTVDALLAGNGAALASAGRHLFLPAVVLGTIPLAIIARMTRSALLEVLHQDYIRSARAKGLSPARVVVRHALRTAAIPIVTICGLQFGTLLGGAVLTESVFAWPGIGKWLLEAVTTRDFRAIQGGVLLVAIGFMLVNLLVDLCYAGLDPRIRVAD